MKRCCLALFLVIGSPALAQEADDAPSLMERGAQMFLEGLMKEVNPRLDELQDMAREFGPSMRDFFQEMGPALGAILEEVEDWSAYHPPEILPNGDIIIRRKESVTPEPAPEAPDEPIEL